MKKLITIFLILFAAQSFAQYPAKQTIGSDSTLVQSKGGLQGRIINWAYPDTTTANRERISQYPHAQIVVGNLIYLRDSTATKWVVSEQGTSNISILNDSTLIISNLNGSDTFHTSVSINNWTILSDTTVRVCDGVGSCDTVYTAPTAFAKSYVDSVIIHNGANLDTLYYYVNGSAIVGGYIGGRYYNKDQIDSIFTVTLQSYYTQTQIDSINTVNGVNNQSNHIISGGIVTWSGTGLTYYISACTYMIGGVVYNSPQATITLDPADATNPRIDLFAVDTLGEAIKITGTAAATPLTPQIDQNSQLGLTTGINLPPNATVPTVSSTLIYDENTEWTTGGTATVNFNNTTNPYHGTKDAYVSAYSKNSTLTFSGTTQTVNGQTLRFFIDLLNANYSFQLQFYNGSTAVSNNLALNGFGFNSTLYNSYQNISIPLSSFSWSGTAFDKLVITMTGRGSSGTYYLDYVSLENGTPVIPPPADYSYKVDSVINRNDSLFYVIKGIHYYSGFNAYQKSQTDSITAQLRTEIVSAAGGGVISFNGRNGAVTSDSTDYNSFFYTKHLTDSLLALKLSAANLSLGTVTSTSQAINNSAGTGVTLPSASITAAGLMTAGDKVLVNTIPLKVAYADTASMLSSYLRKTDAFTKAQADLLYKPISYVPTWTEITGKPTFATVATTGSYADLINKPTIPAAQIQSDWNQTNNTLLDYIKNKPTIPTNNNQLTNGAGYITSIDSSNFVKKTDSISVALLNGGKIDTSHLPTSTTVISHEGVGLWTIYASNSDTIHAKNIHGINGITVTTDTDSSLVISSTGGGSGNPNSNIGSGYRLAVPFTNNIRTIFSVSPIGIDSVSNSNALTFTFDTTLIHTTAYNNTVYGSLSQQNTNTSNIASNTTAITNTVTKQDFTNIAYATTITWDNGNSQFPLAKTTATGSFTLLMTNVKSGAQGVFKLITSTSSPITIAFDTATYTNKILNTKLATYTFAAGSGKEWFLEYIADGSSLQWIINDSLISTGSSTGRVTIGDSIVNATTGSVFFAGSNGRIQQDNSNFYYDSTNLSLRIGASSYSNHSKLILNTTFNSDGLWINSLSGYPAIGFALDGNFPRAFYGVSRTTGNGVVNSPPNSFFIRATNSPILFCADSGQTIQWRIDPNGSLSSTGTTGTAWLHLKPSTTSMASLRFQGGVTPTSPNNGDMWYDSVNNHLSARLNDVTYNLENKKAVQSLTDGSTITWDVSLGYNAAVTIGATGRTLSITNPIAGGYYTIKIIQDGTGSRTITTWPTNTKWPSGLAPTLTTTAGAVDIVCFFYDGTNYYANYNYDFK